MSINHLDAVAIAKAKIEGWEPFYYRRVGDDGSLIRGGIPRVLTRGPRKGKKTWDGCDTTEVFVTWEEVEEEEKRFEATTGLCANCGGEGQRVVSWHHIEGTKSKPCKKCGGTGKAQP